MWREKVERISRQPLWNENEGSVDERSWSSKKKNEQTWTPKWNEFLQEICSAGEKNEGRGYVDEWMTSQFQEGGDWTGVIETPRPFRGEEMSTGSENGGDWLDLLYTGKNTTGGDNSFIPPLPPITPPSPPSFFHWSDNSSAPPRSSFSTLRPTEKEISNFLKSATVRTNANTAHSNNRNATVRERETLEDREGEVSRDFLSVNSANARKGNKSATSREQETGDYLLSLPSDYFAANETANISLRTTIPANNSNRSHLARGHQENESQGETEIRQERELDSGQGNELEERERGEEIKRERSQIFKQKQEKQADEPTSVQRKEKEEEEEREQREREQREREQREREEREREEIERQQREREEREREERERMREERERKEREREEKERAEKEREEKEREEREIREREEREKEERERKMSTRLHKNNAPSVRGSVRSSVRSGIRNKGEGEETCRESVISRVTVSSRAKKAEVSSKSHISANETANIDKRSKTRPENSADDAKVRIQKLMEEFLGGSKFYEIKIFDDNGDTKRDKKNLSFTASSLPETAVRKTASIREKRSNLEHVERSHFEKPPSVPASNYPKDFDDFFMAHPSRETERNVPSLPVSSPLPPSSLLSSPPPPLRAAATSYLPPVQSPYTFFTTKPLHFLPEKKQKIALDPHLFSDSSDAFESTAKPSSSQPTSRLSANNANEFHPFANVRESYLPRASARPEHSSTANKANVDYSTANKANVDFSTANRANVDYSTANRANVEFSTGKRVEHYRETETNHINPKDSRPTANNASSRNINANSANNYHRSAIPGEGGGSYSIRSEIASHANASDRPYASSSDRLGLNFDVSMKPVSSKMVRRNINSANNANNLVRTVSRDCFSASPTEKSQKSANDMDDMETVRRLPVKESSSAKNANGREKETEREKRYAKIFDDSRWSAIDRLLESPHVSDGRKREEEKGKQKERTERTEDDKYEKTVRKFDVKEREERREEKWRGEESREERREEREKERRREERKEEEERKEKTSSDGKTRSNRDIQKIFDDIREKKKTVLEYLMKPSSAASRPSTIISRPTVIHQRQTSQQVPSKNDEIYSIRSTELDTKTATSFRDGSRLVRSLASSNMFHVSR